ncbi:hypothetical protein PF005_g21392 [Phytophthora fragariae]|uniref:Avirulence (Avh) protein n=1 Tax=Phytophthora fragariae TaxID=53985 RepID=A0A6A3RKN9_9STRA|nr:hypothetical protein PF003_g12961 [Phytophthora fragariae]KAE8943652.1 hypothetical protein PF009_g6637 [Phytophthora fragariae]KAE8992608.1 hypothetical protein PF011_g17487 [Phytophthora fragariae]KAE9077455.1 hypothetical protein PF010_g23503 [Phytophthora fragariae]KAE9096277.1 hypothetical protein PF007_g17058 [Phytophthora fragariae]
MDKGLMTWLNQKKSVENVSKKLGVFGKQQNAAKLNPNWEALLKYSAMKKVLKEESVYARFGTGLQSKFKTDENLMRWALNGDSVKSVAQTLGVSGLPRVQLISHENYYAFKTFLRWRKEYAQMVATNFQSMT